MHSIWLGRNGFTPFSWMISIIHDESSNPAASTPRSTNFALCSGQIRTCQRCWIPGAVPRGWRIWRRGSRHPRSSRPTRNSTQLGNIGYDTCCGRSRFTNSSKRAGNGWSEQHACELTIDLEPSVVLGLDLYARDRRVWHACCAQHLDGYAVGTDVPVLGKLAGHRGDVAVCDEGSASLSLRSPARSSSLKARRRKLAR